MHEFRSLKHEMAKTRSLVLFCLPLFSSPFLEQVSPSFVDWTLNIRGKAILPIGLMIFTFSGI